MSTPQDPFASPSGEPPQGYPPPAAGQQPAYGQPGYGQPGHGDPGYGQPGFGQQPGFPPPPGGAPYGTPGRSMRNGLGVAALVLGVLSLVSWFLVVGGLIGLVAIVLGVLGRGRAKRGEASNGGVALAGIITGALGLLLTVLFVAGIATLFNNGEFGSLRECLEAAGDDREAIEQCRIDFEESLR